MKYRDVTKTSISFQKFFCSKKITFIASPRLSYNTNNEIIVSSGSIEVLKRFPNVQTYLKTARALRCERSSQEGVQTLFDAMFYLNGELAKGNCDVSRVDLPRDG